MEVPDGGHVPRGLQRSCEFVCLYFSSRQINDLLGNGQFDSKKHEIKIDKDKMTVTDTVSCMSPLTLPADISTPRQPPPSVNTP